VKADEIARSLENHLTGAVVSINVSGGGVPKSRVSGAQVSRLGLVGDAQDDKKHHGGPERAVCLYSLERIRALQAEGHPIDIGTVVVPGTQLQVGNQVMLEVASFTNPCKTIKGSFIDGEFIRIAQRLHPGWSRVYARVVSEGQINSGDPVRVNLQTE